MGTLVGTAVSTAAWVGGSGVGVRSTVIEQAIVPSRSEPRIKRKAVRFIVPPIIVNYNHIRFANRTGAA